MDAMDADDVAVALLQEVLRVPTTSHLGPSSGSYAACVAVLERAARERGFTTRVWESTSGKPVLLCTKVEPCGAASE